MRRRKFMVGVGGSVAWPLLARAQQQPKPVIGFLAIARITDQPPRWLVGFREGLRAQGFIEGQNVAVDYRSSEGRVDSLPGIANQFVTRGVAVIVATGSGNPATALAARRATSTTPIVAITGGDPVKLGLVASLSKPGGNVTGVNNLVAELAAKRLEMLRELSGGSASIGVLVNPLNPDFGQQENEIEAAIRKLQLDVRLIRASTANEVEAAFDSMASQPVRSMLVSGDPLFGAVRDLIASKAARMSIATMFPFREYVQAGGLMSYGPDLSIAYRLAGEYAGRIIKGEKPSELPVQQPTRFELVINLKTAKVIGIDVPPMLLARADEVIE